MFELNGIFFAMLGAAIASGLAGTGSAKGCGVAGEAAAGVIAEDPSKFGLTLLLQALPGTQGIYGTLMAFLVLNKIGAISGNFVNIDAVTGMLIMFSCIPVGLVGWTSGYAQGKTCAAGICMIAKRPEEIAKGMVYGAMVETLSLIHI